MNARPRKGLRVAFTRADGKEADRSPDVVTGLRFTIVPQHGAPALIDYISLRPRRLALAFASALRRLAAPGGPLAVRTSVKAYATALPRFFRYLHASGERIDGVEDLEARHIDDFEAWLEAEGLSRTHLFTVLVKVVMTLRAVDAEAPASIASDLRDRLRYISAKPFQRSSPRDALSPFVARQLRDAARADIATILQRLRAGPRLEGDERLRRATADAHAVIAERGVLTQRDPVWWLLYGARYRRGLDSTLLTDALHSAHHLIAADLVPLFVLLSLETGIEIECVKTLGVDCLRNPFADTVEVAYFKRRARGAEHKTIRARDRSSTTPGGLIRCVVELTAAARRHHPSQSLWVHYNSGKLTHHVGYMRERIDAWTVRHGIADDHGQPLRLLLSRLRKTHKSLWYLKTEGHMTRFAVGHTVDVAARHYADLPSLRPLHEATVAAAFEDALAAATGPRVITPHPRMLGAPILMLHPRLPPMTWTSSSPVRRTCGWRAAATSTPAPSA